jgi:hypothetical protein
MASSFPSSLDAFTNPSSTDAMDSVSVPHATQHADLNDAVEALEAKVGADSSAVSSSHDYKIAQLEAASTGKILQVVRATDTTNRTTTSLSFVDANISVTITPTSATSNILLVWSVHVDSTPSGGYALAVLVITDSSNNIIDGTGDINHGIVASNRYLLQSNFIAWDSPATTSATTYKGRFHSATNNSVLLYNTLSTAQLFAIEVGA